MALVSAAVAMGVFPAQLQGVLNQPVVVVPSLSRPECARVVLVRGLVGPLGNRGQDLSGLQQKFHHMFVTHILCGFMGIQ